METYPIIGMSPGNSYFKDAEVENLLRETVGKYGRVAIFVADVPAIPTVFFGAHNRLDKPGSVRSGLAARNAAAISLRGGILGADQRLVPLAHPALQAGTVCPIAGHPDNA